MHQKNHKLYHSGNARYIFPSNLCEDVALERRAALEAALAVGVSDDHAVAVAEALDGVLVRRHAEGPHPEPHLALRRAAVAVEMRSCADLQRSANALACVNAGGRLRCRIGKHEQDQNSPNLEHQL